MKVIYLVNRVKAQFNRLNAGHASGGVRGRRRLPPQLLREPVLRAALLRRLRADGAVRARQRGRRRPHEAPGRVS